MAKKAKQQKTTHVVITSFTEKGYLEYGKEFIASFYKYWPKSVKLVVYYEGTNKRDGWKSITEVPNLEAWMRVIAPFQLMHGALFDQYDIRYDARTNRVIFMQNHALRTYKCKVFWIDGDCVTHAPVPRKFLDTMLPDDKLCCYLGREGWYDSETGFIGFNYAHKECEHLMKIQENTLFSGIIFAQERWWDMCTFDWSRKCMVAKDKKVEAAFVDLAKDLPPGNLHVFINSAVGAYLDHKKGARKQTRSTQKDLNTLRPERYWQSDTAHWNVDHKEAAKDDDGRTETAATQPERAEAAA